MQARLEDF